MDISIVIILLRKCAMILVFRIFGLFKSLTDCQTDRLTRLMAFKCLIDASYYVNQSKVEVEVGDCKIFCGCNFYSFD